MKTLLNYFKKNYVYYIIVAVVLLIDLLSKHLLTNKTIILIENVLSLTYAQNTGAAFSMFSNSTLFLIIISCAMIVGIVLYKFLVKHRPHILFTIAYPLILGGAIGNLFDRIVFGYVRDFISLDFINFAIFNIADSAICIGFILLAIYLVFIEFKSEQN